MTRYFIPLLSLLILSPCGQALLAAPVAYSGKVAINGLNFDGTKVNRYSPVQPKLISIAEQPYVAETAADVTDP